MIIIDTREKKLIEKIKLVNLSCEIKMLEIGDVIVQDYILELKRGYDLIGSIYDHRIFFQIEKMKSTSLNPMIVVYELTDAYEKVKNNNVLNGFFVSCALSKIPVVPVKSLEDIIYVLKKLDKISSSNEINKNEVLNISFPKLKNDKERMIAALSCCEGIGFQKAKKLIDSFGSLKNLLSNVEKIPQMKFFGCKTTENIKKVFLS